MSGTSVLDVPVIGAAILFDDFERLHNWILESQRDIELHDFCYPPILDSDWRIITNRYKPLLDGYTGRLGIHGPFWGLDLAPVDPAIREVVKKRILQGLDICEEIGATQMVLHSPYTIWDHNNLDNEHGGREVKVRRFRQTLEAAVKRAEEAGVEIVLENVEDMDPALRVELAAGFDSKALKVSLDTGHAHFVHCTHGAPPVDYYVKAAGKALAHVHLQDVDGYADRHWVPGLGTISWHAVFEAIHRLRINPRMILELNNRQNIADGVKRLADMGLGR
ncbi:MAG: sugar phosphate isomerase/epimerase family protein [Rhizobiaceae bacterium]